VFFEALELRPEHAVVAEGPGGEADVVGARVAACGADLGEALV
jgi:hypothetical protein